jgi:hypothetical protein
LTFDLSISWRHARLRLLPLGNNGALFLRKFGGGAFNAPSACLGMISETLRWAQSEQPA